MRGWRTRFRRLGAGGAFRKAAAKALSVAAGELADLSLRIGEPSLKRSRLSGPPIIVHNMAKVGSKTVVASILAHDPKAEVYQTHLLTPEGLEAAERKMETLAGRFWEHLDESRRLSRRIRLESASLRWRVISLVRDPVARDVSYFFQCLNLLLTEPDRDFASGRLDVEGLKDLFLKHLDESSPIHFVPSPLRWFDDEMTPVFGIDVFSKRFPKNRGYQILRGERADLLLLRLESFPSRASEAFGEFLAVSNFTLVNANTAQQRMREKKIGYYKFYDEFIREARFPRAYLDRYYSSKLVRHFYTEEEIGVFKDRWRIDDRERP
jgi:hypothetical protein